MVTTGLFVPHWHTPSNYQQGDDKDYVKLTDIKNTLKQSGIKEKDIISIKKLVEETFSEVEFKEISSVDKKRIRNFFLKLKLKWGAIFSKQSHFEFLWSHNFLIISHKVSSFMHRISNYSHNLTLHSF